MPSAQISVFTIGHSVHSGERFMTLLRDAGITAVADVRTSPYSRHCPQFNRDDVREQLRRNGISYAYLGKELGGRPGASHYYCEGVADYEKIAQTDEFKRGLERVVQGARKFKIALMCAEQDPLDCHRCLLVGRALAERGVAVDHIQSDGAITPHAQIEEKLLELCGRSADDLFASREQRLLAAYKERGRRIAFAEPQRDRQGFVAAE